MNHHWRREFRGNGKVKDALRQRESPTHSEVLNEWGNKFEKGETFETALRIWLQSLTLFEFPPGFRKIGMH
jgi:hypothetical protein